jgi:hypothetical protein
MRKNTQLIIKLLTFALVSSTVGCEGLAAVEPQSTPPNSFFSEDANEIFISFVSTDNINTGISIEKAESVGSNKNDVGFSVFNHTNESVVFPNQGFGIQLFGYEENGKMWVELFLPHSPSSAPKTLPAKIEEWSLALQYTWSIPGMQLESFEYQKIRIFISGKGNNTNTKYGAFLDILVGK